MTDVNKTAQAYNFNDTCRLERDIDSWVEQELSLPLEHRTGVPDFWDELDISGRLAHFLIEQGWRKQ